jgi:signal transduction histidine kinase
LTNTQQEADTRRVSSRLLKLGLLVGLPVLALATWLWSQRHPDRLQSFDGSVTSISDLQRLRASEKVLIAGTVTFVDPIAHTFYLQDQTAGMRLQSPADDKLPRTGDRVEVQAVLHTDYEAQDGKELQLSGVRTTVQAHSGLPPAEPLELTNLYAGGGYYGARRVEITGIVRFAERHDSRLELETADQGKQIRLMVLGAESIGAQKLVGARIKARGVLQLDSEISRRSMPRTTDTYPQLWLDSDDLSVIDNAPAHIPLVPSVRALITDPQWLTRGSRVRVQGTVWQLPIAQVVLIESDGVIMPIETPLAPTFRVGQHIEASGWPSLRDFTRTLQRASVTVIPHLTPQNESSVSAQRHPTLTSIAKIRQLSRKEAALAVPVSITGVVTTINYSGNALFIQVGEDGIFVDASDQELESLQPGDKVHIDGLTAPGGFAPIIAHPQIAKLGATQLPIPQLLQSERVNSGAYDSEWVELEGMVRPITHSPRGASFNLLTSIGQVAGTMYDAADHASIDQLVDSKVRMRGVFATTFTNDGVLVGYRLLVPSLKFVETLTPPSTNLQPEPQPIRDLLRYSAKRQAGQRALMQGVVTLRGPGEVYVQDATGGILVRAKKVQALEGDHVEAFGYPTPTDQGPMLDEAIIRSLGDKVSAVAAPVTASEVLNGNFDNRLVEIEARLLSHVASGSEQTLVLQSGFVTFNARLDGGLSLASLRAGSVLRLRGVCAVRRRSPANASRTAVPISFQILLRTASDVHLVRAPPWWSSRHAWSAVGVLTLCVLLAMSWVAALRRRVSAKTAEIELQRASEKERLEKLVCERTQELERSREQYRLVVEGTQAIPFALHVENGQFEYIGPQGPQRLGFSEEQWKQIGFLDKLMPRDRNGAARTKIDESTPGNFELETTVLTHDKRRVDLRFVVNCENTAQHRVLRGMMLDVTDQRRLESDLAQAQKLESVGRLAAGVAHEINTPVQFVSDSVCFVREAMDDVSEIIGKYRELRTAAQSGTNIAEAAESAGKAEDDADLDYILENAPVALDRAREGLGRVAAIVGSMKEFAHPDHKEMVQSDLNRAISSTLVIASNEYKYLAEVETEFDPDLPLVNCYAGEINQVLLNLIVNAAHTIGDVVKGTANKGKIKVTTRVLDDQVEIAISDTGKGIPVEVRSRIFDPFFTTKEVGKGTGQGLAIARAVVVEKHGGSLHFETEVGRGTTFFIRLPISGSVVSSAAA